MAHICVSQMQFLTFGMALYVTVDICNNKFYIRLNSYQDSTLRCKQVGLRIHWNAVKVPGTFDFWNPWSKEIPHLTLTAHNSVQYNTASPEFADFSALQKSLVAAATSDVSRSLVTDEEPIIINVILGITALVHNQSKLGFSRDRGGVSF